MCNINNIVESIVKGTAINKRNTFCTAYSTKSGLSAYFDYSKYHFEDFSTKYVVYLIVAGNSHYVGITDCVSRRMQQHIDNNESIINAGKEDGKIYFTIVHIADDKDGARMVEDKINTTMQYIHPKFILNKVR